MDVIEIVMNAITFHLRYNISDIREKRKYICHEEDLCINIENCVISKESVDVLEKG